MRICLIQFLEQHGMEAIQISLTLAALGFSIFGTIYSNLIHNAEMAYGYALEGSIAKNYWLKVERHLRGLASLRAYLANFCYLSLLFIIITLILFFSSQINCWLVTFIIAVLFLIAAGLVAVLVALSHLLGYKKSIKLETKKHGKLGKCLWIWRIVWPIDTGVPRLTEDC